MRHKCLFAVDKQHEQGHKYAVSSAVWYPVDTGLFVTRSYDHHINVWDTSTTQVVMDFKMPGRCTGLQCRRWQLLTCLLLPEPKMFKSASVMLPLCLLLTPCLATAECCLCGFCSHLEGPKCCIFMMADGVMTVEWSTSSEWVLLTGRCDGAIRFWDIRPAGCFHGLDQSQSQLGRRPPILERSATIKGSTVKSSSPNQSTSAKARAAQRKLTNGSGAKHSPFGKGPVKGSMNQRLHPGMLSSQERAAAHYGAVTGLKVTEDGMYLLSAGSDSRLRLWDIESGCNTLVNFETVRMQTSKPIQLATSQNSELVFVPCMIAVKAFDMWSGKTSLKFRGHCEHSKLLLV